MRILVTGGLGLIGHNIIPRLYALGHTVVSVDIKTDYGILPKAELDYLMAERIKKIPDPVVNFEIEIPTVFVTIFFFEGRLPDDFYHIGFT